MPYPSVDKTKIARRIAFEDLKREFEPGLNSDRAFAMALGFAAGLTLGLLLGAMMVALWWAHMGG
jgi:hypothetical protein